MLVKRRMRKDVITVDHQAFMPEAIELVRTNYTSIINSPQKSLLAADDKNPAKIRRKSHV